MIGSQLISIRGSRKQGEMADWLGVHKNTYARWERDDAEMGAEALTKLVADGWNANWVLTGEGPERMADATNVAQPVRLDPTTLGQAIGVLMGVLEERDADLALADIGQAVLKIYDGMQGGSRSLPQAVADLIEYRNRNRG